MQRPQYHQFHRRVDVNKVLMQRFHHRGDKLYKDKIIMNSLVIFRNYKTLI